VDQTELGLRIRQAREALGLTQEQLALLVNRDQSAISEYEHGERRIFVTELPVFARALRKSILYFYEGELQDADIDHAVLQQLERLPSLEVKKQALELIRVFSDTCELLSR